MQTVSSSTCARPDRRRLAGAVFGAAATFLVLLGATAVADAPRQLSDVSASFAAAEAFSIALPSAPDAAEPGPPVEPAMGSFDASGLLEHNPALA